MYCQNCGSENNDTSKYCRKCGSELFSSVNTSKKPKRKIKVFVTICLAFVLAVLSATLIFFKSDFKTLFMNDFEQYIYLEKKNINSFLGKDIVRLLKNPSGLASESKIDASISGDSLNYDCNIELYEISEILKRSYFVINSNSDKNRNYNLDIGWLKNGGSYVLDLTVENSNDDIFLSSDAITDNAYAISKNLLSGVSVTDLKYSFDNLVKSVYRDFGGFDEYFEIHSKEQKGKKVKVITFDFNYELRKSLSDYIFNYILNDGTLIKAAEGVFSFWATIDYGEENALNIYYEHYNCNDFKTLLKRWYNDLLDDLDLVSDKSIDIKYEVILNGKKQIISRNLILNDSQYNNSETLTITTDTNKNSLMFNLYDDVSFTLKKLSDNNFYFECNDDNVSISIEFLYSTESNTINLEAIYSDEEYYCGYNSWYGKSCYDDLQMSLNINTKLTEGNLTVDTSKNKKSNKLNISDIENLSKNAYRLIYYSFEDVLGWND